MAKVREPTHAGSWYSIKPSTLSKELDGWLNKIPNAVEGQALPVPNARMIIAPHAGYAYSGSTAAWAYKALDFSKAKRIFLLGPSHHYYLNNCAITSCTHYATPLGNLKIDQDVTTALYKSGKFRRMSIEVDEAEHSLEMHLPYIYKMLSKDHKDPEDFPTLVPILVGNTSPDTERKFGAVLAPYLAEPDNFFVISSDFAHWGLRFNYTFYLPKLEAGITGVTLRSSNREDLNNPLIYESIEHVDKMTMNCIRSGRHDNYLRSLETTGNTVCGRHPIGIMMVAMEVLAREFRINSCESNFRFIAYARSSDPTTVRDSSVSYASGYAVVRCGDIRAELKETSKLEDEAFKDCPSLSSGSTRGDDSFFDEGSVGQDSA